MIQLIRLHRGEQSTLSHLYMDDIFQCYALEDSIGMEKKAGDTCIPPGYYELGLNRDAGMNLLYRPKMGKQHQGMVEILGIPNFSHVFFHIGNRHGDTAGCPLLGMYYKLVEGNFEVYQSAQAYKAMYPKFLARIACGQHQMEVINRLPQPFKKRKK